MDEAVSVILYGLAEVIGVRCCSMILPSMSQIREGKEFSQLTNGVSGVSVVLRVGLLCRLKELREADAGKRAMVNYSNPGLIPAGVVQREEAAP